MKKCTLLGCFFTAALSSFAQVQSEDSDTLQNIGLQEIEILSIRATETTPIAYTNIDAKELSKYNSGVDFPYLIAMTPSAITTSDAGAGIGYTTLRVRGTDATRINVTANGVPVNDAESHSVFWVNMPDLASSVKDVQIQRGVGTSTNGAGSFGASINMSTATLSMDPYAELNASYGSFNTHKETVKVGTGIIKEHWSFDARFSNIQSDGYIDRASTNMQSYYLQGAFHNNSSSVRLLTFGGKEKTYHAWNYASKQQMQTFGRRFNSCGYIGVTMPDGSFLQPDIDYDIEGTKQLLDNGGKFRFYNDQTDNYVQHNYQLLFDHQFNRNFSLNIGAHYTKGDGYYQEYKLNRKLKEYMLPAYELDGAEVKKSDLVRRKAMDNHFGGGIFSVNYKNRYINTTLGGAFNHYSGDHFGNVLWVKNYIGELNANHEYYRNKGKKNDANIYLKAEYSPIKE
ncbi:MAG: TonB-dependent receptor plug domain-containing protein, partial [Bacteroidaceae bacterium]|nr:TonB-dependent receptor plug domain-containing protein [Bacteroidaceae bacterium]